MAVAAYHSTQKHYPPAFRADQNGVPMHSWRTLLLPYLSADDVFKAYQFEASWDGPHNRSLEERMPRTYALHGEERPGNTTTNYLAVVGPETIWQGGVGVPQDAIKDNLSQTILIVENKGANVHWMEPRDLLLADMNFKLGSTNGISSSFADPAVVMVDSTVIRLTRDLSPQTLRALLTINGSEKLEQDDQRGWHLLPDGRDRPRAEP